MNDAQLGQRWISENETELGLGIVVASDLRTITLLFPGGEETRVYARKSASLARLTKQAGDTVTDDQGRRLLVTDCKEQHGILIYTVQDEAGDSSLLPETRLGHSIDLHLPQERLLAGQIDGLELYRLRHEWLEMRSTEQGSVTRGLLGARIDLIAHQLDVAHEVSQRQAPRVLLADEVGLGKTIEAGLILHRQWHYGWVRRCLIVVPANLQHQWLVELLRRFNLSVSLFDAARIAAEAEDGGNPFQAQQLILIAQETLLADPNYVDLALQAGFDMLIVDEAHHLDWTPAHASAAYTAIARLAECCPGVLLLTATPEQLGFSGHFARLHMLDPQRFPSLAALRAEEAEHVRTATWASALDEAAPLPPAIHQALQDALPDLDLRATDPTPEMRQKALDSLIDRHGTGRLLFRNTRKAIGGFPRRQLHIHALTTDGCYLDLQQDWPRERLREDARLLFLVTLLRELRREKTLLICREQEVARRLEEHLRLHEGLRTSMFHEGMSLLERDRAAAYFADLESGAQVLICSEIGSEGRNFQFAAHLILFDLPEDADLLEQRIGRLDRIGQRQTIQIHVMSTPQAATERQIQWYHEGLDAFERSCKVGQVLQSAFAERRRTDITADTATWQALISAVRTHRIGLEAELEAGRDRLLELSSYRPQRVATLLAALHEQDSDARCKDWCQRLFDALHIQCDELDHEHLFMLRPDPQQRISSLPGLDEDGLSVTWDRATALAREDVAYLSWEHPLVQACSDLFSVGDLGNTHVARLTNRRIPAGTLLLEALFQPQVISPQNLALQDWLPQSLIRVLIDEQGQNLATQVPAQALQRQLQGMDKHAARRLLHERMPTLRGLLQHAEAHAERHLQQSLPVWREQYQEKGEHAIARLIDLQKRNPSVRQDEIDALRALADRAAGLLAQTRLRLTGLCLIVATGA